MAENPVYTAYVKARAEKWERERKKLDAEEFMRTINPGTERKPGSAARYLRKLRQGTRSGNVIKERAKIPAGMYNVSFKDESGSIVDSVNVEVPRGGINRLDDYQAEEKIREAADRYMRARMGSNRYMTWKTIPEAQGSSYEESTEGLEIAGMRKIKHSKYPTEIVRPDE